MRDVIETFAGATIQHGPDSNRIYLMDLGTSDPFCLSSNLLHLAHENGYTKIFATIPETNATAFLAQGYRVEAKIPGFYNGTTQGLFLGAYLADERKRFTDTEEAESIIAIARRKAETATSPGQTDKANIRECAEDDIPEMSRLYQQVFDTYPFPIQEEDYLLQTMRTHVRYFGAYIDNRLTALSSAEMHRENGNVEMTDFATHPDARGQGLAIGLLQTMEEKMVEDGLKTAYTIARALSAGMNIVFAKAGYAFAGTLVNNTQIAGSIESMNVWYKPLE